MATDLRYPIGPFAYDGMTTAESRRERIEQVARAPAAFRSAISGLSETQLDTPYRPGGWTIRQLIHHIPDSHLNAYTRFKLGLTETNPTIRPYDEARWAELPDARSAPAEMSLRLLDALHERWTLMLRSLDGSELERTIFHPERNATMTLDEVLALYAWHGRHHVAHVTALAEREGWTAGR